MSRRALQVSSRREGCASSTDEPCHLRAASADQTRFSLTCRGAIAHVQVRERGEHGRRDQARATPPDKERLRRVFLREHLHSEDEIRFFVESQGLFCLHIGAEVLQGALISVATGSLCPPEPATDSAWDLSPASVPCVSSTIPVDGWHASQTGLVLSATHGSTPCQRRLGSAAELR